MLLRLVALGILSISACAAETPQRTIFAYFPRDVNNWETNAIDWSAITHLCFRSVILQPDGSIRPAAQATHERIKRLVEEAHKNGVKVVVLAWGTTPSNSSKYLANCPERTVLSLLDYVKANNLDGVNIDDETWKKENTEKGEPNGEYVTRFFKILREHFKAARADYHLSWASPGVISAQDKFGEAWIDYAGVAEQIDAFTIMSYVMNPPAIGWSGGAQPVDGGGKVGTHARDYVTMLQDYLEATGNKKEKLLLGISNDLGGTEWTCRTNQPLSQYFGRPRKLTAEQATENSKKYGRKFDPVQRGPWYCYPDGENWVQGWYEDDESISAKVELAKKLDLPGVMIWVIDGESEPPGIFNAVKKYYPAK
jgi:spore germination protein